MMSKARRFAVKYWQIFKISFNQEFAYKASFVMWRVRNVIQVLIAYFLWSTVFVSSTTQIFGYDRAKILTYIFGTILIRALVFSARSVDVPQEISDGNLSNYLVRPVAYFKYWFTRDASSKALNFIFSFVEFALLVLIFRPPIYFQTNVLYLLIFIVSLLLANYLIFVIRFIVTSITFWIPELAWGGQFLFMVIVTEFLSGSIFPLDIFPSIWQKMFYLTPFPYLIFFPLQVYLGKIPIQTALLMTTISLAWCVGLSIFLKSAWKKGLKVFSAEGR